MRPKPLMFCPKIAKKNKVKDANPLLKREKKSMTFVHVYTIAQGVPKKVPHVLKGQQK